MFALTPLAVALQGIGYGTLLTSLQGLVAVTVAPADDTQGAMAAIAPRHPVRRWRRLVGVPSPLEQILAQELADEDVLLELGVL